MPTKKIKCYWLEKYDWKINICVCGVKLIYKGLVKVYDEKYKLLKYNSCRKIELACVFQKCRTSTLCKCDMKRIYITGLVDSVPVKIKQDNSRRSDTLI